MTRVLTTRVVAVLLAGGVALGACGDDGPSEAEKTEMFCEAAGSVSEFNAALTPPSEDVSLADAKERVLAFVDRLETMLDVAPEEIEKVAEEVRPVIEPLRERVTNATSLEEIGGAFAATAKDQGVDQYLLSPIYLHVVENCPS